MTTTKVLLYSGGLDSYCLRHLWNPDHCVYVDLDTRYAGAEVARLPDDVDVEHLPLGHLERDDAMFPLRNVLLALMAAQYGGNEGTVEIALAATETDRSADKTYEFADLTSELLSLCWSPARWTPRGKTVRVLLPVKHLTKAEVVRQYLDTGGDPQRLVDETFSCYTPRRPVGVQGSNRTADGTLLSDAPGEPCGVCKPCWRRWVALAANGLESLPDCREHVANVVLPAMEAGDSRDREDQDVYRALGMGVPA